MPIKINEPYLLILILKINIKTVELWRRLFYIFTNNYRFCFLFLGPRLRNTDPDLLIIKATSQSMMCALENCYKILQHSSIEQPIVRTYSFLNSKPTSLSHSKRKTHTST